jgi:hypothetical protein
MKKINFAMEKMDKLTKISRSSTREYLVKERDFLCENCQGS